MNVTRCMLTPRRWTQVAVLLISVAVFVVPTGCSSSKSRKHWWQFWRSPAGTVEPYNPNTVVLPPPPDIIGKDGTGSGSQLGSEQLPLPGEPNLSEPEPIRQEASASGMQTIYFAFDSDQLSQEAMNLLDMNAQWLVSHAGYEVQIEGHCDERGTNEYNLNLGDRRAKQVKGYLVQKGIDAERLHTISYGEERPVGQEAGQSQDSWWAKNRRVQFLVYN